MSPAIVHGGGITAAARLYGGTPGEWLDLSTGINPNPVALPEIAMSAWHRLPDAYLAEAAREAARTYYRSVERQPLPVPGTQSVIQLLPRLVEPDRRVAILSPTYGEYSRAFQAAGFTVDHVDDLSAVGPSHGLVVAVNPNNPDGRILSRERLEHLHAELVARNGLLLVDEAFADAEPDRSLAPFASRMPNLVIFRSFGKFFGLAGLRLGFVIARPDILQRLEEWLGPWAVSGPALSLAASLLAGDTVELRERILQRRAALAAVLERAGLRVAGGTALFALVEDRRAGAIHEHLCRHHILVRKFDYAPNWLRFGLAPGGESDRRLADALAAPGR
ncbi:threonine-phosphate decarboxylase CobD [Rhizobium sp. BK251]|uniref:threonine-phosphate decarboxylase CobD n=1 Tax=Rhizobium sp. BK251 TaxID=2512125 RepID=UPI001053F8D5|nr:threonine-phosphate decarboxylase CobD [Rhizobium sp. BK251]TCL73892.1 L-threonine O-3-phosphate decarboxylase [Rhizobium sp. BK251]